AHQTKTRCLVVWSATDVASITLSMSRKTTAGSGTKSTPTRTSTLTCHLLKTT
ncbi:hypothetical protein IWW41_005729, partial [Coemansia sp. RSA 2522]